MTPDDYGLDGEYPVMPWGKYADEYIEDIPSSYLNWCLGNYDADSELTEMLIEAIQDEMDYRDQNSCHFEEGDKR